jgi:AraC-like DNA-binding protein
MLKLPAPELNVRSVMGLVSYLTAIGVDTSSVLAAAGLHPNPQAPVPERISRSAWLAAHHEAVRVTRDPLLALHVSAWLPFGSLDVLDYLLVRSTTVGEGMVRSIRYTPILHEGVGGRLEVIGNHAHFSHWLLTPDPEASRFSAEFAIGVLFVRLARIAGVDLQLAEIRFAHPSYGAEAAFRQFFGCPVYFGAGRDEVIFPAHILETKIPGGDAMLCAILERQAESMRAQFVASESVAEQVRRILREELDGGDSSLDQVAHRLATTPRTLQRRLQDENTSHQLILRQAQYEVAMQLLHNRSVPIGAISYKLGFSEPSAFHRAFRRWTGTTPAEVRRSRATPPLRMVNEYAEPAVREL